MRRLAPRSRILLLVHRLALRSTSGVLRPLWAALHAAATHAAAAFLGAGAPAASVYVRGSTAGDDLLPALSDIDLFVVADRATAARVSRRWPALRRRVPFVGLLFDQPQVHDERALRRIAAADAFTAADAVYGGGDDTLGIDRLRALHRPLAVADSERWRRLRGPERRPWTTTPGDEWVAVRGTWLELRYWWRWVYAACADPVGPRTTALCVKLAAEPVRLWLALVHGERVGGRREALARGLELLEDEEPALRAMLAVQASLTRSPVAPMDDTLAFLVRMSQRLTDALGARIAPAGVDSVTLVGAPPPGGDGRVELLDWRGIVSPSRRVERGDRRRAR
jgi:predicted nucleotidyltransferase